jgi:YD repeat-containing protein
VSNSTGSSADWQITAAVTYDSTDFTAPSFLVTTGAMAEGYSAASGQSPAYFYYVPEGGYAPNGNILMHSDSVMGDWAFSYDAMDRLATAAQLASTATSTQFAGVNGSWSYDSYGNRTAQTFSNGAYSNWATYNSANNRIATAKSAVAGYVYDASGNTLNDGNNKYWYDAEGQLCAVQSLAVTGLPITQYIYDGMGARIGKGTLSAAPPNSTSLCAPPLGSGFTLTTRMGRANFYHCKDVQRFSSAILSATYLSSMAGIAVFMR